jgi:hypothetical protein
MIRNTAILCTALALAAAMAAASEVPSSKVDLSATEVVAKNVAARGGLQSWKSVQTMTMEGKMAAGGNQRATVAVPGRMPGNGIVAPRPDKEVELPFLMELKRSRKSRIELKFNGQTAIQVYDGANGWKLRPYLNRLQVENYTPEELKLASTQADLDGPLVDAATNGTRVEMESMEKVEGRDTYKLKLTQKNGTSTHVWVDAQTFLEAKIEGQPRRLDGTMHPVEVYYRDYRSVSGLQVPFVLETRVVPAASSAKGAKVSGPTYSPEKITIEKVVVNPKLDESLFSKPSISAPPPAPVKKK